MTLRDAGQGWSTGCARGQEAGRSHCAGWGGAWGGPVGHAALLRPRSARTACTGPQTPSASTLHRPPTCARSQHASLPIPGHSAFTNPPPRPSPCKQPPATAAPPPALTLTSPAPDKRTIQGRPLGLMSSGWSMEMERLGPRCSGGSAGRTNPADPTRCTAAGSAAPGCALPAGPWASAKGDMPRCCSPSATPAACCACCCRACCAWSGSGLTAATPASSGSALCCAPPGSASGCGVRRPAAPRGGRLSTSPTAAGAGLASLPSRLVGCSEAARLPQRPLPLPRPRPRPRPPRPVPPPELTSSWAAEGGRGRPGAAASPPRPGEGGEEAAARGPPAREPGLALSSGNCSRRGSGRPQIV